MGENKITRDVYRHYANRIVSVLKDEGFYQQFKKRVDKGSASFKLAKKRLIQDISIDWIDTIESILPNLDTIVRNPRKFIVQEEDIVDVSLARSISTESVKFLAQHTNMISKVDKNGDVTPSKILNITKEESFEIYENRFIYTLLLKLKDFVTMRYDKIKKASATQDVLELDVESRFNLPNKKITFRTEYFAQLSFDEIMRLDPDTLTKIERVAKIDRIITDFLSSSFAKSMRNSAPVRPPIMRTNVILKEPNFKKALTLWQFIETYQQTAGFSTSDEVEDLPLESESTEHLKNMVTLNTMLFESMYDECETDLDMEDKEFADFLRVGQMDFQKDELQHDEFSQKLEDEIENEEEQDNVQEVKPQEEEDANKEIPPEIEKEPEIQEKEVIVESVVERPVEVERFKELPPKADQEEVDLEPDAEKFDQHLFEVRRMYRRPGNDKLKQEDIVKVKDAIDRCLNSYRRIKQEEIDDRERKERIRRRKEDIEKRAAAFRKQRESLENSEISGDESVYFGIDPFGYQKAKIAEERRAEEFEKKRQEMIKRSKQENIELDDSNTDDINKSIEEMESENQKELAQDALMDEKLDAMEALLPNMSVDKAVDEQQTDEAINDESEQVDGQSPEDNIDGENAQNDDNNAENDALSVNSVENNADELPQDTDENVDDVAQEIVEKDNEDVDKSLDESIEHQDDENIVVANAETQQDVDEQSEQPDVEPAESTANEQDVSDVEQRDDIGVTSENASKDDTQQTADTDNVVDVQSNDAVQKPRKPREKVDPWGLSPTTLNQKYSMPSGKERNFAPIDENKVAVGGITFADGSGIDNPFGISIVANKAETGHIVEDAGSIEAVAPVEQKQPAKRPKRKKTRGVSQGVKNDSEDVVNNAGNEQNAVDNVTSLDTSNDEQKVPTEDVKPADAPQNQEEVKKPRKPREKVDPWGLSPTTLNQKYSTPSGKERNFEAIDENKVAVGGIRFSDGTDINNPFGMGITANRAENYDAQDEQTPNDVE